MNSVILYYYSFLFIFMISEVSNAQAVCAESRSVVPLRDGKEVVLFSESMNGSGYSYYYLPGDLHISEVKGNKEFLFQPYHENGADGAIMHMLLTWGIGQDEEDQIKKFLVSRGDSLGVIAGNVNVEQISREAFAIVSTNSLGRILNRSLNSQPNVPSHAGSKMALSFNFKDEDASKMKAAMKNPQKFKGISFQLIYHYQVKRCRPLSGEIEVKELILQKDLGELLAQIKQ